MKKLLISLLAAAALSAFLGGCRSTPPAEENLPSSQGSSQSLSSQPEGASSPMEDFLSSTPSQTGGSYAAQPAPESTPPAVPQESSSQDAEQQPSSNSSAGKPQAGSSPSSAPEEGSSLIGTYLPQEDLGAIRLTLTLQEGDQYTLKLSAFLLSGTVSGSYAVNGSQVSLAAEAVNLPGYSAENVGSLEVTLQEDGSLFYPCGDFVAQVGITQESITFVKE